jgi:adenylate cyclase
MADLVVKGIHDSQQLRLPLSERSAMILGRGERADLAVPWDLLISRRHAQVRWNGERLQVRKLDTGRNDILYRGRACDEFEVHLGEEFQIGKTTFLFEAPQTIAEPAWPVNQSGLEMLSDGGFQTPARWLEVLSRLPRTIANSTTDEDFARCVVGIVLEILPRVDTVAVLHLMGMESGTPTHLRSLCWDSRKPESSNFQISRTIVKECLQRQQSLIHLWNSDNSHAGSAAGILYTQSDVFDWTFCVPMITQEASWGWCLYMSGFLDCETLPILDGREQLHEELRFVELLAQFIGALRDLRLLESRKEGRKQFFPPAIRDHLASTSGDSMLRPRENDISVLFCQFRATAEARTSPASERVSSSGSAKAPSPTSQVAVLAPVNLLELSQSVDRHFQVMSQSIFAQQGVMADFQGDSCMSFWGWPLPTNDGPLPACRTALAMRQAQLHDPALMQTRLIGGIAHGPGLAGQIGTEDQCKMGVFGHVVNLGSRLRSMARQVRSGILMDAATGEYVKEHLPRSEGRSRKLGQFRPKGMEQSATVYELLLPVEIDPTISDQHLADFEGAVELISRGEWEEAKHLLHSLPSEDPCKHFLIMMIAINGYSPPPRCDGVFSLLAK